LANSSGHWEPLFLALQERGAAVVAMGTGTPPPGLSARFCSLPGRLITVRRRSTEHHLQFYLVSPGLFRVLRRLRPNVVICMEYSLASLWAVLAAKVVGRPSYLFQEHSAAKVLRPGLLKRWYRRLLVRLADGLIANTPQAREELIGVLWAPTKKIVDLPLLVPRDPAMSCAGPPLPPRNGYGPEFLVVGRLVRPKNVGAVIEAAATLRAEGLEFGITVVGDGPAGADLRRQARDAGLDGTVTFVGRVPAERIGHHYRRADVFVLPSLGDYRSLSVLEALHFGLPVLDSELDGNAGATVIDGHNGFVFDPHSVADLTSHMRVLISKPELRATMAKKSAAMLNGVTPRDVAAQALRQLCPGADIGP
jgi:glycosyltransferase involved in cell wall biosynthesis